MVYIIIGAVIAFLIIWMISVQRRLAGMDENINNAMSQIGIQLSSCFDALTVLLDLTKGYAAGESQTLVETVRSRRSAITATSAPKEVLEQERVISEVFDRISVMAEQNPGLRTNDNYARCMNAVDGYEKMLHTSCLIYNDNVTRLNRELRMFPTFLIGSVLGFHQREYLVCEN